jgi:hypothetical protein
VLQYFSAYGRIVVESITLSIARIPDKKGCVQSLSLFQGRCSSIAKLG